MFFRSGLWLFLVANAAAHRNYDEGQGRTSGVEKIKNHNDYDAELTAEFAADPFQIGKMLRLLNTSQKRIWHQLELQKRSKFNEIQHINGHSGPFTTSGVDFKWDTIVPKDAADPKDDDDSSKDEADIIAAEVDLINRELDLTNGGVKRQFPDTKTTVKIGKANPVSRQQRRWRIKKPPGRCLLKLCTPIYYTYE